MRNIEICIGSDSIKVSREEAEGLRTSGLIDDRCGKCSNDFDPVFHPKADTMGLVETRVKELRA